MPKNIAGYAAPRLKDAAKHLSAHRKREVYVQAVKLMRRMWITCRLVHADLRCAPSVFECRVFECRVFE
jgi:serine/threonine-protein kinase RIO1